MLKKENITAFNQLNLEAHKRSWSFLGENLSNKNIDLETLINKVGDFQIAIPSWALGTGGTRFGRFPEGGEPKTLEDKIRDVGLLHALNQSSGAISLHIPWDIPNNYDKINSLANEFNIKFDVVFSLSEIEHKYDPVSFIKNLKKILSKKGVIILRIPNYDNIYAKLLGKCFFKYDFRVSHNFYFSEKNLDLLFKKLNLKIIKKDGFNEYSFNHLLNYIFHKKRFGEKKLMKFFKKSDEIFVKKNIENSLSSTSLIYLLK